MKRDKIGRNLTSGAARMLAMVTSKVPRSCARITHPSVAEKCGSAAAAAAVHKPKAHIKDRLISNSIAITDLTFSIVLGEE